MTIDTPADCLPIPDRYKNYDAISRGKREWEQTFDAVPDLILIIDPRHTVSRVNRAMAARCGLLPAEFPGRKCYELFHGLAAPPEFCPLERLLKDGCEQTVEIEERHLDASFEITVSPLYDAAGDLLACVHVARDVTERKRIEAQRLALEQQLQQAQKLESLGVLAGGIAHDFNNILMIILGHCFLAKQDLDPEAWETNRLKQIEVAASRASDLCRQMLAYAGKTPIVQKQMDPRLLVEDLVVMLKGGIKKNVALEHDVGTEVPEIMGDKIQIQQIVLNLIVNAVEAIGEDGGVVRVGLSACDVKQGQQEADCFGTAIPVGSYARLDVADTGCGMTAEVQARIFEPFFTTKFTGRGLGLSAMIGIVNSHKGAVQISSLPGAGTTFRVYFAASANTEATEAPRAPESFGSACSEKKRTVLLVDDEDEVRRIGADMLARMGYRAVTARNGREAVEIYRTRRSSIDLILMDLTMPEMDGIEAYEKLRKESPSVPIVICSGYGKQELSSYLRDDVHARAFPKPYSPDQVRSTLRTLLGDSD